MTEELNVFVDNGAGVIELDRPKALNSLSHAMIDGIRRAVDQWQGDPAVDRVLLRSTERRAFCAGGDVRAVAADDAVGHTGPGDEFFEEEYSLNRRLATYEKPIVALLDGVVMGGGFGISAHGSHRVVTPTVLGAMPEAAIGFVPDVGMTHRLTHLAAPAEFATELPRAETLGVFLGTTGWRLNAADMLVTGLATHLVEDPEAFGETLIRKGLEVALGEHARSPEEAVHSPALVEHSPALVEQPSRILRHAERIEELFGQGQWQEIEQRISSCEPEDDADRDFLGDVRKALANANPTSLVATTLLMRHSAHTDLATALRNELVVGGALRRQPNFPEGVRAVLVDKDQSPNFDPATAAEVRAEDWADLLA